MSQYIIGCDEVGTGSVAGPFVVCAVRAAEKWNHPGLNDSKKLSPKKRYQLNQELIHLSDAGEIDYIIIQVSNANIDIHGLGVALKNTHVEAINILADPSVTAILDGKSKIEADCKVISMIKADQTVPTVMAASILAKVFRDNFMQEIDKEYPHYHWRKNAGYITAQHKQAIQQYGLSPYHRKSFKLNINN